MHLSTVREFTAEENSTWQEIFQAHTENRLSRIHPLFEKGLQELNMSSQNIPSIEAINRQLSTKTGFKARLVKGLEDGASFYQMLKNREFPVGNFIRDRNDLNYTPAPDIVHDLYGHIPFLMDPEYADFCQLFGERAMRHHDNPQIFVQFERLFWFTIEFGLIESSSGIQIFGSGIASSIGECEFSLSPQGPEKIPFDIKKICQQDFRVDHMQKKLFVIKNLQQLYSCLEDMP